MKKIFLLFSFLVCAFSGNAQTNDEDAVYIDSVEEVQLYNAPKGYDGHSWYKEEHMYRQSYGEMFKEENMRFSGGLHFGMAGAAQGSSIALCMASFSFAGIYLDIGGWGRGYDEYWDDYDESVISAHAGYIIPITSFFRITPLVGYTNIDKPYHEDCYSGFDFGAQVTINLGNFNIYGTCTKYTWYAGVGIEI